MPGVDEILITIKAVVDTAARRSRSLPNTGADGGGTAGGVSVDYEVKDLSPAQASAVEARISPDSTASQGTIAAITTQLAEEGVANVKVEGEYVHIVVLCLHVTCHMYGHSAMLAQSRCFGMV